jgi:predicted nucleic acid-binding protein
MKRPSGRDRNKRRDVKTDALIALTARHGAAVVTANRENFELGRKLGVRVLAVQRGSSARTVHAGWS